MRFTSRLLVVASLLATSFVTVQMHNKAQAVDPPNALNKPIIQFRAQRLSRGGFYNNYNYQANNYNDQVAPMERRSYSVAPEATADVPPPAPGTYHQQDCSTAPQSTAQRRSYSYQPQPYYQPQPMMESRSYRNWDSPRSYTLPRAMRNN